MTGRKNQKSFHEYEIRGLEEIVGRDDLPAFQKLMEAEPGNLVVQGTLVRAGRAGFYDLLKQSIDQLGWTESSFRLAPVKKKIRMGLAAIGLVLGEQNGLKIQLENEPDTWRLESSPLDPDDPQTWPLFCYYLAGLVQEFAGWAGLGKFYPVHVNCISPDNCQCCSITVSKNPID